MTRTLQRLPQGSPVCQILEAALTAADPYTAVMNAMHCTRDALIIGDKIYRYSDFQRIFLVGAGKAAVPMGHAAVDCAGSRIDRGILVVKDGYEDESIQLPEKVKIRSAGHPLPDERGLAAAREVLSVLTAAQSEDLVICLLSGGASALLTAPLPGVSLTDLRLTTRLLLASGADIHEINTLRKHLDAVKGGGLARAAAPAEVVSLILSDVVGDPLEIIASGPTAPDPSTYAQALEIIRKYQLEREVPPAVIEALAAGRAGNLPETLKSDDPLLNRIQNRIIGSNRLAAQAAAAQAEKLGFHTRLLTTGLTGEARLVGRILAQAARDLADDQSPIPRPACLIAGGETTVTLRGGGRGGRNQELALAAVEPMDGLRDTLLLTLATDGGDGPTDAAGAVVSGETAARARAAGLSAGDYLNRNDAYPFFDTLGDLIKTGPTHTNVNDLVVIFTF